MYLLMAEGGSVQLEIYPEPREHGIRAYLFRLWVIEECRRQGIAKALLDKAEELARSEGVDAVYLQWDEWDTPRWMLDHYVARGYEEVAFGPNNALLKLRLNKE